jgi:hypothetical protein
MFGRKKKNEENAFVAALVNAKDIVSDVADDVSITAQDVADDFLLRFSCAALSVADEVHFLADEVDHKTGFISSVARTMQRSVCCSCGAI